MDWAIPDDVVGDIILRPFIKMRCLPSTILGTALQRGEETSGIAPTERLGQYGALAHFPSFSEQMNGFDRLRLDEGEPGFKLLSKDQVPGIMFQFKMQP